MLVNYKKKFQNKFDLVTFSLALKFNKILISPRLGKIRRAFRRKLIAKRDCKPLKFKTQQQVLI